MEKKVLTFVTAKSPFWANLMIFNRKQSVFPALWVLRAVGRAESWIYVKLNRLPHLCCLLLVWQSVYRVKQTEATSRNISRFSEQGHGQKLKQSAGNVWKTIGSNNTVQLPARIMKGWDRYKRSVWKEQMSRSYPLLQTKEVTRVSDRVRCWGENWPRINSESSPSWNMWDRCQADWK